MPTFKVLRTIEHNHIIYLPADVGAVRESVSGTDLRPPLAEQLPSGAHGGLVTVNVSGIIELSETEATAFDQGQIPLECGKPLALDAVKKGEAETAKKKK